VGIEALAIGGLVASVGSSIVGAGAARDKADAEAASYNYKAQVAANNAIIAKRNADAATQAGAVGAQVQDLKTKNLVATQLVTQAANGLDVNTGTNVDVRQSAADLGHLDTLTILNNAAKTAQGFKVQGMNFEAESGLNKASAANAEKAGDVGVMTSLLGGASSFADKWVGYSSKGVFA
jgi:cobyric acid synthase